MTIVCPQCQVRMRLLESNVAIELMTDRGPYQLYSSDFYECPNCRKQIHLLADYPMSEHFRPGYKELKAEVARLNNSG